MDFKKELQIRLRIESIFNKTEEDFTDKQQYDDYLEEREDIIFNLVEGINMKEMERKIEIYRLENAESIVRNEAKKAEFLRQKAVEETKVGISGPERADVSGTAAAFHDGKDAEPHQGMEYTANMAPGVALRSIRAPVPVGDESRLDITADIPNVSSTELSKENWTAMALASGWTPEYPRQKAMEMAFKSIFILPQQTSIS